MSDQKQNERYVRMGSEPIPRLVVSLAVPSVISMLVSSIYNLADTYFVSSIGTSAAGAVGVIMPLMGIMQAVGMTFGTGASSNISRLLGTGDKQRASQFASTAFFTSLSFGILIAIYGLFDASQLVSWLGATPTIFPHALAYANIILLGAPFIVASFTMNNILRSEGNSFLSMIGISVGVILNIILDPIFIFVFDLGVAGAAYATILSQSVSFVILLSQFLTKRSNLTLSPKNIKIEFPLYRDVIKMGSPSLFRQSLTSIAQVLMNQVAGPFGDAAIAAVSIVSRVMMIVYSAMLGLGQGYQPVAGYNYGAKRFDRLKEAFWFTAKMAFAAAAVVVAVIALLAPQVMELFNTDDAQVVAYGVRIIRLQALVLPLQAFVIITNMTYQAMGKGLPAFFLALSRNGFCYIPMILILPRLFGIDGVTSLQAATDVLSFLIALPLAYYLQKLINQGLKEMDPVPIPQASS